MAALTYDKSTAKRDSLVWAEERCRAATLGMACLQGAIHDCMCECRVSDAAECILLCGRRRRTCVQPRRKPCACSLFVDQCGLQLAGRRLHACGSATRTRLDQTNLS